MAPPPPDPQSWRGCGEGFWGPVFPADGWLGSEKSWGRQGVAKGPAEAPGEAKGRRGGAWRADGAAMAGEAGRGQGGDGGVWDG